MTSNSSTSDSVVKESATLNWIINDFSERKKYSYSENFSPPNSKNTFRLYLVPKLLFWGVNEVCIYLCYNANENELTMRYRVSIMNENGEKQYSQENYWKYFKAVNYEFKHRSFLFLTSHAICLQLLVNGNLILNCEVDILEDSKMVSHKTVEIGNGQSNLQIDYQSLLENSEFSDVVLLVKQKEFKVHKAILAARSKVFRAMFSNELEEKKQNRVEITDVEVDVFEHLLRYIYSGKIPEMDEYTLELFVAADKYQLDHLKSACEKILASNLTTEAVVKVLVIADMHNASELKSKCIEYINSNSIAVKKTEQWNQIKSRATLLLELYDHLTTTLESISIK